jgi:serine protease inhibitor
MLLTNAVHFTDSWTAAFDEILELQNFTLASGRKIPVRMMARESLEISARVFNFKKILPAMNMTLVTLGYSVSSQKHFFREIRKNSRN